MVGNKRESVNTLKMVGRMARRRFKGLKMTLLELMERQEGSPPPTGGDGFKASMMTPRSLASLQ